MNYQQSKFYNGAIKLAVILALLLAIANYFMK